MRLRAVLFLILTIIIKSPLSAGKPAPEPDSTATGEWKNEMIGTVSLSQAHFDNWSQGGENTLAWQVNLNAGFVYRSRHHMWTNTGNLIYGQARIGDQGTRKSADEIKLESVYQYTIGSHVNPFTALTFQTQFARGYNYSQEPPVRISDFMDPGYVTFSIGAGTSPYEGFTTRLGAAYKATVTNRFATHLTDDPEKEGVQKFASEFGISSVSGLRRRLAENILLRSRLELFSNLKRFDEIDVRWDVIISAKVTEYINVRLNTELFYDSSVSKKRQLRQVLSLGFSYTFI